MLPNTILILMNKLDPRGHRGCQPRGILEGLLLLLFLGLRIFVDLIHIVIEGVLFLRLHGLVVDCAGVVAR